MDNSNNIKSAPDGDADELIPFDDGLDEPTPLGEDNDKPIPLDDGLNDAIALEDHDKGGSSISHSPLHLGRSDKAAVSRPGVSAQRSASAARKPAQKTSSDDRITGIKTFFTKLHIGAISFLDEQICNWLKQNPDVVVKRTDTVTGMVQGKKSEPNIIVTIWY